jgi:hypothetical protein
VRDFFQRAKGQYTYPRSASLSSSSLWSDLVTTSAGRTPEQAPALDIAHEGPAEPERHDRAGDTQAEPGTAADAEPAHDDDDLTPLLERP